MSDRFAADGYVALAPAIFDRAEPGFAVGYKQEDIELGRAVRAKIPIDDCVKDVRAAVQALRAEGVKVGVVGYCFGGTLAWLAATRIDGVACAVASAISSMTCPASSPIESRWTGTFCGSMLRRPNLM